MSLYSKILIRLCTTGWHHLSPCALVMTRLSGMMMEISCGYFFPSRSKRWLLWPDHVNDSGTEETWVHNLSSVQLKMCGGHSCFLFQGSLAAEHTLLLSSWVAGLFFNAMCQFWIGWFIYIGIMAGVWQCSQYNSCYTKDFWYRFLIRDRENGCFTVHPFSLSGCPTLRAICGGGAYSSAYIEQRRVYSLNKPPLTAETHREPTRTQREHANSTRWGRRPRNRTHNLHAVKRRC